PAARRGASWTAALASWSALRTSVSTPVCSVRCRDLFATGLETVHLLGVLGRRLDTKTLAQEIELAIVLVGQVVSVVHQHLHLSAETGNRTSSHTTAPGEAVSRIDPLATVVRPVDAATTGTVEHDRMHVDLASPRIDQDEAPRRFAGDLLVALATEQLAQKG